MNSVLFFGFRFLPYFSLICPTLLLSTHPAHDFLSVPSFLGRSLPCLGYLIVYLHGEVHQTETLPAPRNQTGHMTAGVSDGLSPHL